jgi:hypothetical protein
MNLLGSGPVHFLANNLFNFADNPITQWQVGIDAAGQFPDHPRPNHQLVADNVGIGRNFPSGGQEHF